MNLKGCSLETQQKIRKQTTKNLEIRLGDELERHKISQALISFGMPQGETP